MSHVYQWRCQACPTILGQVRAGVLTVLVPGVAIGHGKVAVACPECQTVRVWTIEEPVILRNSG